MAEPSETKSVDLRSQYALPTQETSPTETLEPQKSARSPSSVRRRPSYGGVPSTTTPVAPLPEKELKFLFDFNDKMKKGYLTKEEFVNLLERIRKRDRIPEPLDPVVSDAVFFLLDPTLSGKLGWDAFKDRFNDVFWKVKHQFYHGDAAETFRKKGAFSGPPIKPLPKKFPSKQFPTLQALASKVGGGAEVTESLITDFSNVEAATPAEGITIPSLGVETISGVGAPVFTIAGAAFVGAEGEQFSNLPSITPPSPAVEMPRTSSMQFSTPIVMRPPPTSRPTSPVKQQAIDTTKTASKTVVTKKTKPPLVPQAKSPPASLPKELALDIRLPKLYPEELFASLKKVPGLPGVSADSRWLGRAPLRFIHGEVSCPHCGKTIDPAVLEEQWRRTTGPYGDSADLLAAAVPSQTYTPLYGPFFYSGMWTVGSSCGNIPPSFFGSPYNIHAWYFARPNDLIKL